MKEERPSDEQFHRDVHAAVDIGLSDGQMLRRMLFWLVAFAVIVWLKSLR